MVPVNLKCIKIGFRGIPGINQDLVKLKMRVEYSKPFLCFTIHINLHQILQLILDIRGHWSIENRLHWVKDVRQHEDSSRISKGNGVETLSLLKNIAINLCREDGFDSIKAAAIHFASNVKELLDYFRT